MSKPAVHAQVYAGINAPACDTSWRGRQQHFECVGEANYNLITCKNCLRLRQVITVLNVKSREHGIGYKWM